jgi:tRNA (cytidine/uridine-2'-O-)-methyltransferase
MRFFSRADVPARRLEAVSELAGYTQAGRQLMFHVVLYEPEIPPNTGNIARLCANAGATLHLICPLGFSLNDRRLRRAGLDYADFAHVRQHADWARCRAAMAPSRVFAVSTRARLHYDIPRYAPGDAFLFGPETRGLPAEVLAQFRPSERVRIPMPPHSRSLNLANAVAVVLYEAWRQFGFAGADRPR